MSTVIDNFTVTEVNHVVSSGGSIPSTVLTLSPLSGYVITATDFSATIASPLQSVVFSQDGENVLMTIVFIAGFTITSDLSVPVCIDGASVLIPITLNGVYNSTVSNATPTSNGTYAASGNFNNTTTVLTKTFTADTGKYFYSLPTATLATGNANSYNISNATTSDANSNVVSSTFTIDYTFPSSNVSGDVINFIAEAIEIYVPAVFVNSYSINSSSLLTGSESRVITLTGNSGANYTLDVQNSGSTVILNTSGVIPASGTVDITIAFPSSVASETYTITLSGDLNPNTICSSGCSLAPSFTISSVIPTAIAATYQAHENQSTTIQLNGSDPLDQPLTYIITSLPTGTSTLQTTGTTPTIINENNIPFTLPTDSDGINNEVVFIAASNAGTDGFGFKVNNGTNDSAEATATVDIVSEQVIWVETPITPDGDGQTFYTLGDEAGTFGFYPDDFYYSSISFSWTRNNQDPIQFVFYTNGVRSEIPTTTAYLGAFGFSKDDETSISVRHRTTTTFSSFEMSVCVVPTWDPPFCEEPTFSPLTLH